MIFWFTGQPGSGKTTLGKALVGKMNNTFHIDGDDLRGLSANVDYSEQGRINNIRTAQSIAMYLDNKGQNVVVSVIAPYKWLREEFKERHKVNEIYVHTTEIRGREHYFAEGYEEPEENFLDIDTTDISVDDCLAKIIKEFMQ
jgi:adenylylsulfate kinase